MEKNTDFSLNTSYEIDLEKDEILFGNSELGGLSNTPLTTPKNLSQNVCIDYLKMRLDSVFSPFSAEAKWLLETLKINNEIFDTDIKVNNYKKTFVFDSNVVIATGGEFTKNEHGQETTMIELKGQACREFEARGGDWIKLFDCFYKLNAKCRRIDIALDDFTGLIKKEQLIKKINWGEYVSNRKNDPVIEYSANGGFSITFGKYSDKTLCIYNKLSERKAKGIDVLATDWMRYESRFKDKTGDLAFNEVYIGLVEDKLDVVAKKLLKGLIEFKKHNSIEDKNHLYRESNWSLWEKLCDVKTKIKIVNQYKVETAITKKINWLNRSASKNRILMELTAPLKFDELDGYFVYTHIAKLKNREIASINYMRKANGLNEITKEEALSYLEEKYGKFSNPDSDIFKFLGLIDDNGELN